MTTQTKKKAANSVAKSTPKTSAATKAKPVAKAKRPVKQAEQPSVTVDGKKYLLADLSTEATTQLANVQAADAEIQRLKTQQALAQTARNTYIEMLKQALAK